MSKTIYDPTQEFGGCGCDHGDEGDREDDE